MKKQLLALASFFVLATAAHAQTYPLVSISDIQTVSASDLAACIDAPPAALLGDTVRVIGIVTVPGGIAQSANGRQIWMRAIDSQGGFNNLGVRFGRGGAAPGNPTTPTDLRTVVPGDTLEITGTIEEFNSAANDGETQINPLVDGVRNIGDGTGPAPIANLLANIGVLNDAQRLNNLPTGEQWEGAFIEVQNVTVTAVDNFAGGSRWSFTVRDAAGNTMSVSDRFLAGRVPPLGTFIPPAVGDQFTSLKGIIVHSKNRCTGSTGRGYEMNPFDATHYQRGASSPSIGVATLLPAQPCSTENTSVTATITDDGTVVSARLFYSTSETGIYTQVPMTVSGGTIYTASIPGQPDGTFIRYYISATDNSGNVSNSPNVPTTSPNFIISRCGGPTIRDLQYTPFPNGNSGYNTRTITGLRGIVTSTASDLGQVYIQQAGQNEWGGIWLSGGSTISNFNRGDEITVEGRVIENFNATRVNVTNATLVRSGQPVVATRVEPSVLSTYDFTQNEKYEGMLVEVALPNNATMFVVDSNVGTPSNFGQYRLGSNVFDPANGVVVQAGNQGTSNFSSLNVSYINNRRWATNLRVQPVYNVIQGNPFATAVRGIVYYGFNVLFLTPRDNQDYDLVTSVQDRANANLKYVLVGNPASAGKTVALAAKGNTAVNWNTLNVTVLDAKGSIARTSASTSSDGLTLNVSTLTPGLYTVRIQNTQTGYSEAQRLVIQ